MKARKILSGLIGGCTTVQRGAVTGAVAGGRGAIMDTRLDMQPKEQAEK